MPEILLLCVLALLILGPERMPETVKNVAIWIARIRRNGRKIWESVEREIDADGIREHIHNEEILEQLGESNKILNDVDAQLRQDLAAPQESNKSPANSHCESS